MELTLMYSVSLKDQLVPLLQQVQNYYMLLSFTVLITSFDFMLVFPPVLGFSRIYIVYQQNINLK
jgi:hypothetical protein